MDRAFRSTHLTILLTILLLGMSFSSATLVPESDELKDKEISQQTRSHSQNSFFSGSQSGSTYTFSTITASDDYTCAVAQDHSMRCWGNNQWGQLGAGDIITYHEPVNVNFSVNSARAGNCGGCSDLGNVSTTALEVSSFGRHTCAIMSPVETNISQTISCWGADSHYQLGTPASTNSLQPNMTWIDPLGTKSNGVQVSAGKNHTCAILQDQSLWCWGDNMLGQIGLGYMSNNPFWMPKSIPFFNSLSYGGLPNSLKKMIAVSVGSEHTCAIQDNGSGYCWGADDYSKLGNGANPPGNIWNPHEPTWISVLPSNSKIAAISAGGHTTCAILDDGTIRCWGLNNYGQYGDGTTVTQTTTSSQVSLPTGTTAIAIDVGKSHACAILNDNRTFCWGSNHAGQLGIDSTIPYKSTPTEVNTPHGVTFSTISTGHDHTCAISSSAIAYCWGDNSDGEIGDGTTNLRYSPVAVNLGPSCVNCQPMDASLGERDPDGDSILSIFDPSPLIPNCVPGYYSTNNTSGCIAADPGHYSASNLGYQIPCPVGTYQPNSGQTSCLVVDPGHYVDVNTSATNQLPCPAGTYNPNSGQYGEVCMDVEPGNYSAAGSAQPIPCSAGTYQPLAGQATCLLADPGHFVQLSMQAQQEACPSGTYQPISGQSVCFEATEGFYAAGTGSTEQTQCSPGTYSSSPGADSCLHADQGHYVAGAGATEQIPCDPGFYQNMAGMTDCLASDPGSYTDQPGTPYPLICPAGTYQPNSEASSCIETPPGYYPSQDPATQSLPCEVGTYAPTSGMSECTPAGAGYFVSQEGASTQEACPAGTHQPSTGQTSCVDNEPGYYTAEGSSPNQTACTPGTYQDSAMAISCMEADSGHYVSEPGSSEQIACTAGTYQSSTGQSECISSPTGHYVSGIAATFSTACQPGTFQPEEGQSGCIDAQSGNIAPEEGMTAQIPCDRGTYQSLSGQTECVTADPGHYVASSASTSQTPCKPGTYQPLAGKMACNLADADYFVSESAATSQTECPDGESQPDRGMTGCIGGDEELPMFAIAGGVIILVVVVVFMQFQRNSAPPKRRKRPSKRPTQARKKPSLEEE